MTVGIEKNEDGLNLEKEKILSSLTKTENKVWRRSYFGRRIVCSFGHKRSTRDATGRPVSSDPEMVPLPMGPSHGGEQRYEYSKGEFARTLTAVSFPDYAKGLHRLKAGWRRDNVRLQLHLGRGRARGPSCRDRVSNAK